MLIELSAHELRIYSNEIRRNILNLDGGVLGQEGGVLSVKENEVLAMPVLLAAPGGSHDD
ncbi:MAG: hypothetical protein WDO12_01610 [Pseudomonadota bacterium]